MKDISPEAYCDALVIMKESPQSVLPISVIEMHLFSYLGCILALFQGKPIGEWGYSYVVTKEGFPFSVEFEEARKNLVFRGLVDTTSDGLLMPHEPQISNEFEKILTLRALESRRSWMQSATQCALALPVGSIRYAINNTPGLEGPLSISQSRTLLSGIDVSLLYEEYKVISSVLGTDARDLLSPAVIWLSARVLRDREAHLAI
jgi:hypothetical protein